MAVKESSAQHEENVNEHDAESQSTKSTTDISDETSRAWLEANRRAVGIQNSGPPAFSLHPFTVISSPLHGWLCSLSPANSITHAFDEDDDDDKRPIIPPRPLL
jgi:hypothetical protein